MEELGRLIKTLYLLRFIDDEAYRRRILVQLNRGEGRHQLARIVFHGKRGELRQRTAKAQEDQLGALGLVVNVIVPWSTIYMEAALNQLRAEGFDVRDDDVARLSPLGLDHINMLGCYAFILPDEIARGELRPLRDPRNTDEESRIELSVPLLPDPQPEQPADIRASIPVERRRDVRSETAL